MKKSAIDYPIIFTRGDTFSFVFDIGELTNIDLTHAYMTCKEKDNPEGEPVFQRKLNDGITKISTGKYRVQIERENTVGLDVNCKYMYDVEVKYSSAIKTIIKGTFEVEQDYTNPDDEGSE